MTYDKQDILLLGVGYLQIHPEYLTSGDIIWVPKSGRIDTIAYLLVENFSEDRRFGLINLIGHKAGRKYVAFPNECLTENKTCLSINWLSNNWNEWVALGKFSDAIYLRAKSRIE